MSRVLVVSPFVPPHRGGLETYIQWLTAALEGAGHEVRWLTTDVRPAAAHYVVPARDLAVGGGTSWPLVLPSRAARAAIAAAVDWAETILHQNCFWNLTSLAAKQAKRRRRHQWTIVHAAFATYPGSGISTRVSADAYRLAFGRRQLTYAPPIAVSHTSKIFVESEYGVRAVRVPCPLPDVPQIPGAQLVPGESVRIAWVGRLAPVKAPLVAIEAVERAARHYAVTLHMFGGGPMVAELPKTRSVVFEGDNPRADVLQAVAASHVFLSTSLADNAQLALLEALVLGRPAVATRVGEAAAYMNGPLAGGLTQPGSATDAAEAIGRVIEDWHRLARLTAARGQELRAEYDPDLVARELLDTIGLP